jgi:hypothetical protein
MSSKKTVKQVENVEIPEDETLIVEMTCLRCLARWTSAEDDLPGEPMHMWLCPACRRAGGVILTGDFYNYSKEDGDADTERRKDIN